MNPGQRKYYTQKILIYCNIKEIWVSYENKYKISAVQSTVYIAQYILYLLNMVFMHALFKDKINITLFKTNKLSKRGNNKTNNRNYCHLNGFLQSGLAIKNKMAKLRSSCSHIPEVCLGIMFHVQCIIHERCHIHISLTGEHFA